MQYFCWRTVQGFNSKIKSSFILPYHTRCGPDWCFGLIKQNIVVAKFHQFSNQRLLSILLHKKEINLAQMMHVAVPVTKQTLVQVYDWKSYFEKYFRKVPNITRYHNHLQENVHGICTSISVTIAKTLLVQNPLFQSQSPSTS